MKPKVYKPYVNMINESGNGIRLMVEYWDELGYCELIKFNDRTIKKPLNFDYRRYIWWGGVNEYMLYEVALLDQYDPKVEKKGVLFANERPADYNTPWFFWSRWPKTLEKSLKDNPPKPTTERKIKSVFLGRIETEKQAKQRLALDWSSAIEEFDMPVGGRYKYDYPNYLETIKNSKFGLCLPGVGPKCNREVELLATGTIPIITPGVDLFYYNPLVENEHYIFVTHPNQIEDKINSLTEKQMNDMSKACIDWYQKTCSPKASFEITKQLIDELS
jgi:hypothetical protein